MAEAGKPAHQNPALPDFWEKRYQEGVTPWDQGGVPQALRDFAAGHGRRPRTLVPGCGSAYEARHLAELGWPVTALDFSAAAVDAARRILGPWQECARLGDFFDFDAGEGYDLVVERAFLCALPRRMWPDYARRMAGIVRPGGLLAGFFFFSEELKGPPFGTTPEALGELLGDAFSLVEEAAASDSIPVFAGRERWQVWRRVTPD